MNPVLRPDHIVPLPPPPRRLVRPSRELVAGGTIAWKPINREAAKLLSRSSEIYHPPRERPRFDMPRGGEIQNIPYREENWKKLEAELVAPVADLIVRKKKALMDTDIVEYAQEVKLARRILEEATDNFREDVMNFTDELPKAVKNLRSWRMTMEAEKTLSIKALTELREFFLGHDYEKEMVRLSEFVRLCEKLKALSADGTLDKVADVMLKLAN